MPDSLILERKATIVASGTEDIHTGRGQDLSITLRDVATNSQPKNGINYPGGVTVHQEGTDKVSPYDHTLPGNVTINN